MVPVVDNVGDKVSQELATSASMVEATTCLRGWSGALRVGQLASVDLAPSRTSAPAAADIDAYPREVKLRMRQTTLDQCYGLRRGVALCAGNGLAAPGCGPTGLTEDLASQRRQEARWARSQGGARRMHGCQAKTVEDDALTGKDKQLAAGEEQVGDAGPPSLRPSPRRAPCQTRCSGSLLQQ